MAKGPESCFHNDGCLLEAAITAADSSLNAHLVDMACSGDTNCQQQYSFLAYRQPQQQVS